MGILGWVLGAGVVVHLGRKANEETEMRRNTPCTFSDGFSESDFKKMVTFAAKPIKRLNVTVKGPFVTGVVQSQSGISKWSFKVDFNDYGHITGKYWLTTENYESKIPKVFCDNLVALIKNYKSEDYADSMADEGADTQRNTSSPHYCPHCGKQIKVTNAKFCPYCGKQIK